MSSFTAALVFRSTDNWRGSSRLYVTVDPFRYWVGAEGSSLWVDVPAECETDLASIPRWLRWLFSPDGPWAQAAVLHDFLYRENLVSRWMCDRIFYEAMRVIDDSARKHGNKPRVHFWQRQAIYWGVRMGGWRPYRRYGAAKAKGDMPCPVE